MEESGARVVVGIDAGGSCTRARAMAGVRVVHEGQGGPGNPLSVEADQLAVSYLAALAGCPEASHVAACVSGAGQAEQREHIYGLLRSRFPRARIDVFPDYVAAMCAAANSTDVAVIAGTGSVVCSRQGDGVYNVSGGRGWILGDRGSAARLGQAALERFCDSIGPDAEIAGMIRDLMGSADWRQIAGALHSSKTPAAVLARAAPVLTRAAEQGSDWALATLRAEMGLLAATTGRHIGHYLRSATFLRIQLSGGVWNSGAARTAFTQAMAEQHIRVPVSLAGPVDPIDGAARIAARMAR